MVRPWLKKGCLAGAVVVGAGLLVAVVVGGLFLVQHLSLEPQERRLVQDAPPAGSVAGKVVLSLSSAAVTVKAGPAGGPIRVESSFDPDVHSLEQSYHEDGSGRWTYRLDFHEKKLLHVSVFSVWLGKRSPEVLVELPRALPLALETKMEGGYLTLDLGGLELTTANVDLDRGVLGLIVSEPLDVPMERLGVKGRIGTMVLRSLGNASPKELRIRHGIGAAHVDLSGRWLQDADVDFRVAFGTGRLNLPDDVHVEGLDRPSLRLPLPSAEETARPTLRLSTHFDMGEIRVIE